MKKYVNDNPDVKLKRNKKHFKRYTLESKTDKAKAYRARKRLRCKELGRIWYQNHKECKVIGRAIAKGLKDGIIERLWRCPGCDRAIKTLAYKPYLDRDGKIKITAWLCPKCFWVRKYADEGAAADKEKCPKKKNVRAARARKVV
jgi:hypothetical protein